ncbi:Crp/Fnr family transcriptional regulator [Mesorhizobium sp. M7D.F.Ca.US.005.01.1.1]|jgi:CRP-like cAMP-binding protein|uniref:CRP-like cAMP-binding protein n=1 Tax=Rhizobium loti TaxID=381 RepID=A0A8E2W7J1_RHILI|nr:MULTISPECIES: Crp/Fnr family transcriptional regulator [Mesorhizobium]AZO41471.1 Crp/Fnr family transcriptional regulator [Mesorhizobium sp. M7D.F.Ca.US.005.01.1.1]PWJ87957.1 CRP-like cAMP-binding protein [Mesorhizobium loti]
MTNPLNLSYKNGLLGRLNANDLALLEPHFERRTLDLRMRLETADSKIEAVYFLEEGLGSVVARGPNGSDAEVGLIGFDGMTGTALVMGVDVAAHECFVQLAGSAVRIEAEPFNAALRISLSLRLFLLRYVHYLHIQGSYTALSNVRAKVEDRLARWLLMCDDRVLGNHLAITHEFLAVMLGVRRPGVTVGLQVLEGLGLIRSRRGEITIRDRAGLEVHANGTYGKSEAAYARLIGGISRFDFPLSTAVSG